MTDVSLTEDERAEVDGAIAAGTILSEDALLAWVGESTKGVILGAVADDVVFAKRTIEAEQAQDKPRTTLIDALTDIIAPPPPAQTSAPLVVNTDTPTSRYFALRSEHGVTPAGNLEPLCEIGMTLTTPTMVTVEGKQEVAEVTSTIHVKPGDSLLTLAVPVRILPGTRVIESADPRATDVLMQTGKWEEIEPPTKQEIKAGVNECQAAINEAANRSDEER